MAAHLMRLLIPTTGVRVPPPAWSPSALAPLVWLDAQTESTITKSSNVVSQWNDRGTNGNNVTEETAGNRPSYSATALNGLPAITSDGFKRLGVVLSGASGLTNKLSAFVIAYAADEAAGSQGRLLSFTDGNLTDDSTSTDFAAIMRRDGANARIDARRNSTDLSEKTITYDTPFIGGSIFDGTNHTSYVDGAAGTAVASSGNFSVSFFPIIAVLGAYHANLPWIGGVGEIIVVIGEVTTADRQKVEGYLAHRWAATGNLAADHPYKNAAP